MVRIHQGALPKNRSSTAANRAEDLERTKVPASSTTRITGAVSCRRYEGATRYEKSPIWGMHGRESPEKLFKKIQFNGIHESFTETTTRGTGTNSDEPNSSSDHRAGKHQRRNETHQQSAGRLENKTHISDCNRKNKR